MITATIYSVATLLTYYLEMLRTDWWKIFLLILYAEIASYSASFIFYQKQLETCYMCNNWIFSNEL